MSKRSTKAQASVELGSKERASAVQNRRRLENFVVVWLDGATGKSIGSKRSIAQLQRVVNTVHIFCKPNECIDFILDMDMEKVFLIISIVFVEQVLLLVHDLPQLEFFYILRSNKMKHEVPTTTTYSKSKGFFSTITTICECLKRDAQQARQNLTPISILSNTASSSIGVRSNHLDPSLMYSQLLKELFLEMNYDQIDRKAFVEFCQAQYADNARALQVINEFGANKEGKSPIYWYTYPSFLYEILNKTLRNKDIDVFCRMGFFVKQLHRQIEELYSTMSLTDSQTVYRGQGMLHDHFDKLRRNVGGLLSFDSFPSTSVDRTVSYAFAESCLARRDLTAVFFIMDIDATVRSHPYAPIDGFSYFREEKEILFSMHAIFRIEKVEQDNNGIWNIDLKLTGEDDPQLHQLTDYMRNDVGEATGMARLAHLMSQMGELETAKAICQMITDSLTHDDNKKKLASIYNEMGLISMEQDDFEEALFHFQKSVDLQLAYLPADHPEVLTTYSNIALVYEELDDLDRALIEFQRILDIDLRSAETRQEDIAASYNNIGKVLWKQDRLDEALTSHTQALEINLKCLPSTHPSLAITYTNIGAVYFDQQEYVRALEYAEKCLDLQQQSLPPRHPFLIGTHFCMAKSLEKLHRIDEAIQQERTALDIARQHFREDHHEVVDCREFLEEILPTTRAD